MPRQEFHSQNVSRIMLFPIFAPSNIETMIDLELENKVKNVIEQIRPYLQADGGDVEYVDMTDEKVVNLRLLGMCGNCPHSQMTLKNGIEAAVIRAIPEIKSVESVQS
jgi:Fe-S cluster biogenesis protein NfuA